MRGPSRRVIAALGLAAAVAAAGAAAAAPPSAPPMILGARVEAPAGFLDFCRRQPGDCGADPDAVRERVAKASADISWRARFAAARTPAPGAVRAPAVAEAEPVAPPATLTPELWAQAVRLNTAVNRAIVSRKDERTYGVADRWDTPLAEGRRYGDCEDYVLEKRRALLAAGVPASALHIALVTTRWGEAHAVLLLSLDRGEYVLDNLNPWIIPWTEAPYRWRARQAGDDPFTWVGVATPMRVAASAY